MKFTLTIMGVIYIPAALILLLASCGSDEPRRFKVMPDDTREYEVICYKEYIFVADYQTEKVLDYGTDTNAVIGLVLSSMDNGVGIQYGECNHYEEDSSHAWKVLYQLMEGCECETTDDGRNLLTLY